VHVDCESAESVDDHWGHFHQRNVDKGVYVFGAACINDEEWAERFYIWGKFGSLPVGGGGDGGGGGGGGGECAESKRMALGSGCGGWGSHGQTAIVFLDAADSTDKGWKVGDEMHVESCRRRCEEVGWCAEFFTSTAFALQCALAEGKQCTNDGNRRWNWYQCASATFVPGTYSDTCVDERSMACGLIRAHCCW
jgi:hypothetical protein